MTMIKENQKAEAETMEWWVERKLKDWRHGGELYLTMCSDSV